MYDKDTAENKSIKNPAPDIRAFKREGDDIACSFDFAFVRNNSLDPKSKNPNSKELYLPRFRYHDGKLYICRLEIAQTTWKNGEQIASGDTKLVLNISDLQNKGEWLIDRLHRLVQAPEPELWETFVKEENLDPDWK